MFEQRTGLLQIDIQAELQLAIEKNLLEKDLTQLQATSHGFEFLNDLQELFLPIVTEL
jgi:oxygen-independent coproporphyrinogen-3 oxidase